MVAVVYVVLLMTVADGLGTAMVLVMNTVVEPVDVRVVVVVVSSRGGPHWPLPKGFPLSHLQLALLFEGQQIIHRKTEKSSFLPSVTVDSVTIITLFAESRLENTITTANRCATTADNIRNTNTFIGELLGAGAKDIVGNRKSLE